MTGRSSSSPGSACTTSAHTAASLLLAQGVPARVLIELLGHSQIGITMNIYSHVMPTQLTAAADAMNQALWGTESDDDDQGDDGPAGAPTRTR